MRSVECRPEGVTDPRPVTIVSQTMVDHDQNFREGMYRAASNNERRRYPSWIMISGGKSLLRGQIVDVCHPRPEYGHFGRLTMADWPNLWLSEETGLNAGDEAWLSLAMPNGAPWGPVKVRGMNGSSNGLLIDEDDFNDVLKGVSSSVYSMDPRDWIITEEAPLGPEGFSETLGGHQAEATRASVGTGEVATLRCMIVEVVPSDSGQVEVLAVEESENVHTADQAAVPDAPGETSSLSNDGRPAWSDVVIVGTQHPQAGFPFRVAHLIEGPSVPGAIGYTADWAPTSGDTVWTSLGTSTDPTFDGPKTDGENVMIRGAAVGPLLRGAWTYFRTDLSTFEAGKTVARLDPTAQEIYG